MSYFDGGIRTGVKVGDVLTPKEHQNMSKITEMVLNLSTDDFKRPIVDQPWTTGVFPESTAEAQSVVGRMINQYRQGNPMSIHGAAILVPEYGPLSEEDDPVDFDIRRLTDVYMRCQATYKLMLEQAFTEQAIPDTPKSQAFVWENVAFPRMMNNTRHIKAVLILMELNNGHLVTHVVIVKQHEETAVFTTRVSF